MTVVVGFKVHREEVDSYFAYAGYKVRDMREPFTDVAKMTISMVHEQFLTEGARMGTPWEPLSASYLLEKEISFPGRRILVRTGEMELGTEDFFNPTVLRITKDSMHYKPHRLVDGDVDLVQVHAMGRGPLGFNSKTGEPWGAMPARPIFEETQEWYDEVERAFTRWLNGLRERNTARGDIGIPPMPPAPYITL